ncbi:MAG: metallopeptidase family protein [Jannaschia helgolandensis]|jgi:predicted Zn-dependent protease with MMP-like domain|uniref:Predicted Zn-dependent protease, minimal metalloprotease (MMP)-like domain n=1 Tax=Jannaschia helgolandensis TaxID=188906 RepID=A0A1H7MXF2_9RHOB|nr:metallopeptidase family protein [Jannaschia helgolandensis]SEL15307.1 Predicted Zn-dependent protease, minimal metalloprotease (MMP)-like domain [Jannaschia helgolandensis]
MIAPDIEDLRKIAEATRAAFPSPFAGLAADVRLSVEDWPSDDLLDEMEIEDAYDLTGLYEGVALTQRSVDYPDPPSTIFLFRRPILDEWAARGDVTLEALVAHVTVHEFAHHFGWSDSDIARIDEWWT